MSLPSEIVWLKGLFQKYYTQNRVSLPYEAARREFGYGTVSKIDARHGGFENDKEFNAFLQNQAPLFVSASISEYMNPSIQPMEKKGLVGSDLIYEFDADDVETECKQEHDTWVCSHCQAKGKGHLSKCTNCGKGVKLSEWVCDVCVSATKGKTLSLVNVLQDDFGMDEKNIFVNFSGSKGYHVYVRSESIFSLPKSGRIELMDYLSMHEMDLSLLGFNFDGKAFRCPKSVSSSGHAQRIMRELIQLVERASEDEWTLLSGSSPRSIKSYLQNRSAWVAEIQSGYLPALPGKKTEAFWNSVLGEVVKRLHLPIDRQTSGDIHKLIRVPNTLHGNTGFIAQDVSIAQLPAHRPFEDTRVFSSLPERKILVHECPRLSMGSFTLDPVENKEMVVPGWLAVYLVGWGAAELR